MLYKILYSGEDNELQQIFMTARFLVSSFWNMLLCWWFSVPWCFWRNVLPSSRVEGSITLDLLSPWRWRHHVPLKCQGTLTCWQWRHPIKSKSQSFLKIYWTETTLPRYAFKASMGRSFMWALMPFWVCCLVPFAFPLLQMCYTSMYSFSVTACVTICETVDLWKKQPLKNSEFVWNPLMTSISYFTSSWCLNSRL